MSKMYTRFLLILFVVTISEINNVYTQNCKPPDDDNIITIDDRLRKKLLCNYRKHFIPVKDPEQGFNLTMKMAVDNLFFYVTSFPPQVTLTMTVTLSWIDDYLTWNPDDYESKAEITMNTDHIWKPEITSQKIEFDTGTRPFTNSIDCKIIANGNVTCIIQLVQDGYCINSDVERFPFDTHTCPIPYMAFSQQRNYNISLEIMSNSIDALNKKHPEWLITKQDFHYYTIHDSTWVFMKKIEFVFEIQRHTSQYIIRYYLVFFVLMAMTLMTFWIPLNGGDRIMLIMMNTVMHLTEIRNIDSIMLIFGQTVPYIVAFYRDSLIISTIALLETHILKKIVNSESSAKTEWILKLEKLINTQTVKQYLIISTKFQKPGSNEQNSIDENDIKSIIQMKKFETAQILDRIFCAVCFFVYFIITIRLYTY